MTRLTHALQQYLPRITSSCDPKAERNAVVVVYGCYT
jgi:hypothetical protein